MSLRHPNPAEPSVQQAREYVAAVKRALGPASQQYHTFLTTLKGYRTRALSPQAVIERISDLFRGRRDLIFGFNAFLPDEYQIVDAGEMPAVVPMDIDMDIREEEDDEDEVEAVAVVEVPKNVVIKVKEQVSPVRKLKTSWEDDITEDEEEDSGSGSSGRSGSGTDKHHKAAAQAQAQDPAPRSSSRKRLRVRSKDMPARNIKLTKAAGNIKLTKVFASSTIAPPTPPPPLSPNHKLNSSTQILLAPPKIHPSDLLHEYNPTKDGALGYEVTNINSDHVNCKLCRGKRDSAAIANNEPVLLCEQRGCNAEYHLGCLYNYRPALFPSNTEKKTSEVNALDDGKGSSSKNEKDDPPQCPLEVPEGDIFCAKCASHGATSVLEKYFDKIDYERSHYSCSRAYVCSLLQKHMRENPEGNAVERSLAQEKAGMGEVRLRASPRSELWYADELHHQAMESEREDGWDGKRKVNAVGNSAEFLVGKPVRLYNNLDNEYHVGRIVDWRTCTVYPPLYGDGEGPPVLKSNAVHMKDLEYYGTAPVSTSEFLIRFPAGLQGRKVELLRWIVLEEHSLAVGVALIQGRTAKLKGGSVKGWKPAMILARSALELVTVRQFLHEDEDGILFAEMKGDGSNSKPSSAPKSKSGSGSKIAPNDDRWALASFFGEEQHALLCLRDEARDLLVGMVTTTTAKTDIPLDDAANSASAPDGESKGGGPKENGSPSDDSDTPLEDGDTDQHNTHLCREPLATVDVPMGLALAEHSEQARCKEWGKLILKKSDHPLALVSADEYTMQLHFEKCKTKNGSEVAGEVGVIETKSDQAEEIVGNSKNSIRPLIERGMDRQWLARVVEKVSHNQSIQTSKDALISFKCEEVSSVSNAMASLQRQ